MRKKSTISKKPRLSRNTTCDLLGCPFCGATPTMHPWHGGGPLKVMIRCENDDCYIGPSVTGETPQTAEKFWNNRVPAVWTKKSVKITLHPSWLG